MEYLKGETEGGTNISKATSNTERTRRLPSQQGRREQRERQHSNRYQADGTALEPISEHYLLPGERTYMRAEED